MSATCCLFYGLRSTFFIFSSLPRSNGFTPLTDRHLFPVLASSQQHRPVAIATMDRPRTHIDPINCVKLNLSLSLSLTHSHVSPPLSLSRGPFSLSISALPAPILVLFKTIVCDFWQWPACMNTSTQVTLIIPKYELQRSINLTLILHNDSGRTTQ